jgi:hypothetical protein
MPALRKTGKVKKVPPPATALQTPARTPDRNSSNIMASSGINKIL